MLSDQGTEAGRCRECWKIRLSISRPPSGQVTLCLHRNTWWQGRDALSEHFSGRGRNVEPSVRRDQRPRRSRIVLLQLVVRGPQSDTETLRAPLATAVALGQRAIDGAALDLPERARERIGAGRERLEHSALFADELAKDLYCDSGLRGHSDGGTSLGGEARLQCLPRSLGNPMPRIAAERARPNERTHSSAWLHKSYCFSLS